MGNNLDKKPEHDENCNKSSENNGIDFNLESNIQHFRYLFDMYAKTTALRFRSELGLSKKQIEQIFAEENGEKVDENEENLDLAFKNMECQSEVSVASSTGSL